VYFLKVAIVDSYFSIVDVELQRALEEVGIETFIVSSNLTHFQYKKSSINFENLGNKRISLRAYESPIGGLNLYFPFPILHKLTQTLEEIGVDIVQTTEHVSSPTFWCNIHKKGWKTVLLERSGQWNGIVPKFKFHKFIATKIILPRVDGFAALSSYAAQYLKDLGCKKNITLLPNAVDTQLFNITIPWNERKNIILYVGRLVKIKFLDTLIFSMPKVLVKIPDAELWIIGDGEDKNYYHDLAAGKNYIKFLGSKKRNELPFFYNQAKTLVVLTDRRLTGIGMATEEAMACGVPIVGAGPIPFDEVKSIYYFSCKLDPENIAENIIQCVLGGESLSQKARCVAEKTYSHRAVGNSYKKMISSLP